MRTSNSKRFKFTVQWRWITERPFSFIYSLRYAGCNVVVVANDRFLVTLHWLLLPVDLMSHNSPYQHDSREREHAHEHEEHHSGHTLETLALGGAAGFAANKATGSHHGNFASVAGGAILAEVGKVVGEKIYDHHEEKKDEKEHKEHQHQHQHRQQQQHQAGIGGPGGLSHGAGGGYGTHEGSGYGSHVAGGGAGGAFGGSHGASGGELGASGAHSGFGGPPNGIHGGGRQGFGGSAQGQVHGPGGGQGGGRW